jgi:predicted metalloprotease with PDZ domain
MGNLWQQPQRPRVSMRPISRIAPVFTCATLLFCTVALPAPPLDHALAGELALEVDLANPGQRIFRVHERIPVNAGAVTLYYPKWIPGEHSPSGTIAAVTGLIITTDSGQRVEWRRDLEDMFTLHLTAPAGARSLQLEFQVLSPASGGGFGQSASVTERIEDLEWNQVLFYPAGFSARGIKVRPKVQLPAGWGYGTALTTVTANNGAVAFEAVSLEQLIDSPLITGLHFARIDLAPSARVPVHLDLVADHDSDLKLSDAQLQAHRNLVTQALALFGARHYQHYDFLFTLSENTGHFGLEHSQSSDDRLNAKFFTDADSYLDGGSLLPHEYVHSWNGKFRRPAGLATPNFNVPMHDELLWVYEGLTEYLGDVLAARSGIWTAEQYREHLAATAASMDHRSGRVWRNVQDTADEAQVLYYIPEDWSAWRRSVDFYDEGELIWLDADTTIRELSSGHRSLDDFLRAFYGVDDGSFIVKPYTFEDVVKALNAVQPHDWAGFLRSRLDTHATPAPLAGIARGGWTLTYSDQPSANFKAHGKTRKVLDLSYSLGLVISTAADDYGKLLDVLWTSPAFTAGLAPGMKLVAMGGRKFDDERVEEELRAAQAGKAPIELLLQNLDTYAIVKVDYHGGPKYPHLTRVATMPDRLGEVIAPKAVSP